MPGRVLDCPQCGAPVTFLSSVTVFAVCEHCRAMVVMRDAKVDTMGSMAELPPDLSPFQIGAKGQWEGKGFEIVGRVRVEWQEGSWNEWCILYDGVTVGWLAEAQGLLMVSFATQPDTELSSHESDYQAGTSLKILGKNWTVGDVKQTSCRASEGELPFIAPPNSIRISADLMSRHGEFANIEFTEQGTILYVGKYARFEDFRFENLRPVPGWNAEVAEEKNKTNALACPACGAPVILRAVGQSMAAVCGSCGAVIDTATPEWTVIQKAGKARHEIPTLLPIGQRGKLFDLDLEVIGVMTRRDEDSSWTEYLLFNPWSGFRWLVFYDGHWSLAHLFPSVPDTTERTATAEGRRYRLYAKGSATVKDVLGEFYWKVQRGEKADYMDYIAPPHILSKESYPGLNEFTWSAGKYVEPALIAEGFGIKELPAPDGIYLNQPNPHSKIWAELKGIFFLALCALIFFEIGFSLIQKTLPVYSGGYTFDRAAESAPTVPPAAQGWGAPNPKTIITPPFEIDHPQRVTVRGMAGVDNNWLDLDLQLVNAKTNISIPATLEISYYYGYDDGNWSEGSGEASVDFPHVVPGQYVLTIEPSADRSIQKMPFAVYISRGGVFQSNFLLCLGLILLYPLFLLGRGLSFEQKRWSDSAYVPS